MSLHQFRMELLQALEGTIRDFGEVVDRETLGMYSEYHPVTYDRAFGSFAEALERRNIGARSPSREQLLEEYERLKAEHDGFEWRDLYVEARWPIQAFEDEFDSLEDIGAAKEAEKERDRRVQITQQLIDDIWVVDQMVDEPLLASKYLEHGEYSLPDVTDSSYKWFGLLVRAEVIDEVGEMAVPESELLWDGRRVLESEGKITRRLFTDEGVYSVARVADSDEFSSWGGFASEVRAVQERLDSVSSDEIARLRQA